MPGLGGGGGGTRSATTVTRTTTASRGSGSDKEEQPVRRTGLNGSTSGESSTCAGGADITGSPSAKAGGRGNHAVASTTASQAPAVVNSSDKKATLTAAEREEADRLHAALLRLKFAVPLKNLASWFLLGPVVLGECRSERVCVPWINVMFLAADVVVFTGHLILGIQRRAYRKNIATYNFYILSVFWSIWNLSSHPLCRQHFFDLFVAPPELHVVINVAAIAACSSAVMAPPTVRHLTCLVTCEFIISLVLSSIEVMRFSMDSGWLAVVRLDIVMFNIAILLIGSTIVLGTMAVEKDIKNLAHEMEHRLGPSGSFEDDLERRKRAVLTALCDAVLTTSANFVVIGSDDAADRIFRRPILNETFTDFFKDQAEKERFLAAVRRQFPEDGNAAEGPKRMRVTLRDDNDEAFEADVVVSDASTDRSGKVTKYMVGMHIRGEFRARALDDSKQGVPRPSPAAVGTEKRQGEGGHGEKDRDRRSAAAGLPADARADAGDERNNHHQAYDELSYELLAAFEGVLRLPGVPASAGGTGDTNTNGKLGSVAGRHCAPSVATSASGQKLPSPLGEGAPGGSGPSDPGGSPGGLPTGALEGQPGGSPLVSRFHLRRATCEVYRRRTPPLVSRAGDRHVDLQRLSLPKPVTGT